MSHAHVKTPARPLTRRTLMWLPAAALATAGLLAATGWGIVPGSHAASTGSTQVGATVAKEVHVALDTGGACGAMVAADPNERTLGSASLNVGQGDVSLGTCQMTFGSNNSALGAQLFVESARTSGSNSFCTAALLGACSAPQFADVATTGVAMGTGGGQFGETGPAGQTGHFGITTSGAGCSGGIVGNSNRYGLPQDTSGAAGTAICSTSSTSDGTVTVDFRVNPAAAQVADTGYTGRAIFAVTAN